MTVQLETPAAFRGLLGVERGPTGWKTIDQDEVDAFARLTDDPQWIHVDKARAAESAFGGTIVHGYFTLSLIAHWLSELFPIPDTIVSINYGIDRVRFPSPVRTGTRLRMSASVASCEGEQDLRVTFEARIASEGTEKPACVATPVIVYRFP